MRQPDNKVVKWFSFFTVILIAASLFMGALGLFIKVTEWTGMAVKNAVYREDVQ